MLDSNCNYIGKLYIKRCNNITYLLTPWNRVLLEKLIGPQLVNKFRAFYGTRKVHYRVYKCPPLSLFWVISVVSMPHHPTSWRSILILSSHLLPSLPSGLYPPGFPTKILCTPLAHTAICPAHLIPLELITRIIFTNIIIIIIIISRNVNFCTVKFKLYYLIKLHVGSWKFRTEIWFRC